ncbi:hypothetical protein JHK86_007005 [Glycine max]|nr:hypothetical protein JHK86_007005 [Glycine max]
MVIATRNSFISLILISSLFCTTLLAKSSHPISWVVGLVMQINDDSKGELCSKMPFTSLLRAHLRE